MQEEIDLYIDTAREGMEHSLEHLEKELRKVRTGKASTDLVNELMVSYYGSDTPMKQVASISTTDARTIIIQPWEKSVIPDIERSIFEANLGVTPQNDGELVRISIPPLTEDRRKQLVKVAKGVGEDAKVAIRNSRREVMEGIKSAVKDGYPEDAGKNAEEKAQNMTNSFTDKVNKMVTNKESDILTI